MISYNINEKSIVITLLNKNFCFPNNEECMKFVKQTVKVVQDNLKDTRLTTEEKRRRMNDTLQALAERQIEFQSKSSELAINKCLIFNKKTERYNYFWFVEDTKYVSPVAMPKRLVDLILDAESKGVSITPYIHFWVEFLKNKLVNEYVVANSIYQADRFAEKLVDYVLKAYVNEELAEELESKGYSSNVAREMATFNQTPITVDGLIATYKVVELVDFGTERYSLNSENQVVEVFNSEDFEKKVNLYTGEVSIIPRNQSSLTFMPPVQKFKGDAFNCGSFGKTLLEGHAIKVGNVISLDDWSQVDCSFQICKKGLHVGNLDFVATYGKSKDRFVIQTFVSPRYVGSVVEEESVLRVKEYYAHSIIDSAYEYPASVLDFRYDKHLEKQWKEIDKPYILGSIEEQNKEYSLELERLSSYVQTVM